MPLHVHHANLRLHVPGFNVLRYVLFAIMHGHVRRDLWQHLPTVNLQPGHVWLCAHVLS